jgi:hypothetical protein
MYLGFGRMRPRWRARGRLHALHLIRRRRRPEHEPLRERRPAQPAQPAGGVRAWRSSAMVRGRKREQKQQYAPRDHLPA